MVDQRVGGWAFILGVIVAIIAGLAAGLVASYAGWITLLLVILGLIVGFLNIADKQTQGFLIAAIALMAVGTANLASINTVLPGVGTAIAYIVQNVAAFVMPAALVVALKEVYNIARSPTA